MPWLLQLDPYNPPSGYMLWGLIWSGAFVAAGVEYLLTT